MITEICKAIDNNDVNQVRLLIENDPHILKYHDKDGRTSPHYAISQGDKDQPAIRKLMFEYEFDVNNQDHSENSILHASVSNYQVQGELEELLKRGANPNVKNDGGYTPLHEAATQNRLSAIRNLSTYGAKVDEECKDGDTPLHLACLNGHFAIVEALVALGAQVNHQSKNGVTPLHYALLPSLMLFKVLDYDSSIAAQKVMQKVGGHAFADGFDMKEKSRIIAFLLENGAKPTLKAMLPEFGQVNAIEMADKIGYGPTLIQALKQFVGSGSSHQGQIKSSPLKARSINTKKDAIKETNTLMSTYVFPVAIIFFIVIFLKSCSSNMKGIWRFGEFFGEIFNGTLVIILAIGLSYLLLLLYKKR